jgi:hypothetical protein
VDCVLPFVPAAAADVIGVPAAGRDTAMAGALVLTLLIGALAFQQNTPRTVDDEAPRLVRIKPADAEMRRLVLSGHARSATFRALMDEIHQTNVVVVIQFGQCAKGRIRSCVSHVEGDSRQRHIRIKVNTRTTDDRLIATIAHELHHALEIAREPDVTSSELTLALYRRIGMGRCREGLDEKCETEAALQSEHRVNDELARCAPSVAVANRSSVVADRGGGSECWRNREA